MNVYITTDNYAEGYEIIEHGGYFSESFMNYNANPHDPLNNFLGLFTRAQENQRITEKVVNKAYKIAEDIASSHGWNAVLNFDIEYEDMGEWASIHGVNVIVSGYLCNISPEF